MHRPDLQFVMTEQKTGWVPDTLKKMDGIWYAFRNGGVGELRMDGNTLERPPSSYFDSNCTMGASFPSRDEAEAIKTLGVGNVMWGSDYPHREGTYPDSVASLRHVFHDWDPADLHELFGGTAAKLYGLDLEPLAALALGPTVDEVATPLTEVPDAYRSLLLRGIGIILAINAGTAVYCRGIAAAKEEPVAFWSGKCLLLGGLALGELTQAVPDPKPPAAKGGKRR